MTPPLEEMPLFPLNAVLLPYQAIPLFVLDERYVELIRLCVREDRAFGVVLIREGEEVGGVPEPYLVGTSARIVTYHEMEDGKLHVLAVGERRFRIRHFDYSRPYLVGYVEPIIELEWEEDPTSRTLVEIAKEAFLKHLSCLFGRQDVRLKVQFTDDPVALSFAMAGCVQLAVLEKQHLLELTDTAERIRWIIPRLEAQAEKFLGYLTSEPLDEFEEYFCSN